MNKNLDIGICTLLRDGRRGILFGLHGDAGTYFLQTADDNFSPAFRPLVTNHLSPIACAAVTARVSTVFVINEHHAGLPRGVRVTPCWGTRMAFGDTPSSMRARTNIHGSKACCGLGKIARSVIEPVLSSTVTSENCKAP